MPKYNKLSPKQKMFCLEYLIDLNGSQAAIRAGYKANSARITASKWLSKANIQEEIQKLMEKREKIVSKKGQDVIEELIKIGFADITQYAEITTKLISLGKRKIKGRMQEVFDQRQFIRLKDFDEWTETTAIQEISQNKDGTLKIKLYDKRSALTKLAKHFGVIKDLHEHMGKDGNPIQMESTAKVIIGLPGKNLVDPPPNQEDNKKKE